MFFPNRFKKWGDKLKRRLQFLREHSIPLVTGIFLALIWVNTAPQLYYKFIRSEILLGHHLHFFVNDVFMALFFAMAGVDMVQSLKPGGNLNPIWKVINPLVASLGGVLGPIIVYLSLNAFFGSPQLISGWGIPTATDIALAWIVAKFVFGEIHPVVNFLLILAIADDIIGLIIVAVFYPEPLHPVQPIYLLAVLGGMGLALFLRLIRVSNHWVYLLTAGSLSWVGLYYAYLHPALALIFIIPFMPPATLSRFKRYWSSIVDFGLLMFGLTNAGVEISMIGTVTWLVFFSLIVGKTLGIYLSSTIVDKIGFSLPFGMRQKELLVAGLIASMGLTVALLITNAAFTQTNLQGAAKMGALLSISAAPIAFGLSRFLRIRRHY